MRDITPPAGVMQAMEKQMRAEREKRALIAQSEGEMQARINMAEGAKPRPLRNRAFQTGRKQSSSAAGA